MAQDLSIPKSESGPAKRVLVIGGVAGGASAAARLRRLDERAEIVVFDRGPYVSFANCGLPYYVGNVIAEEKKLLVASAELFRDRFRIDVRTDHEVLAIDRTQRTLTVKALKTGVVTEERWDALVLSPGATAIKPPIPGIDLPGIFSVRTIPDSRRVREWLSEKQAKTALVVGGGFIGLEMAENLAHRGLSVTIVEKAAQLLPPLDPELAPHLTERLVKSGVTVRLGQGVTGFANGPDGRLVATIDKGAPVTADLVILAIGVRPETGLARAAGLALGTTGGILVDESMRTSDPAIWAVGDAVETIDVVTGLRQLVPLAGPANRQGRVAADSIAGRGTHFRGVQGTAVCGAFGLTVALTGASEKTLKRAGLTDYDKVYLHPNQHVGYYPGAKPIHLKVLYRRSDGRLLGAQALGEEGVEKRIDVLSMAIQLGGTVHDLSEAELSYAPQYGSAKDPVNFAGFIAENSRNGDMPMARWEDVGEGLLLDVREPGEVAQGPIPGAVNIPLHQLRTRLAELPKDVTLRVTCAVGQRAYYAVRLLRQNGLDARQLPGGYQTFKTLASNP
jgi:NADPH-dependent 2,4-dienoyl-CoA reductase/sulfur reductase-like enzyme/rhodanese-related sulfurtransferase